MSEQKSIVAEQFEDAQQQREASHLGMWIFIATEILFFGGLFLAYTVYRHFYFDAFAAASRHTDVFYGTLNSVLLLTSSLTIALAVQAAKENRKKVIAPLVLTTILLGLSFLTVKGLEYHKDIADRLVPGPHFDPGLSPPAQIFFWFYWVMTGLHGLHVLIGLGVLSVMAGLARRGKFSGNHHTPLALAGLYWHFVDIIWVFLYPLLYLVQRSS